ncbi:protein DEHYDRATION-INDUCED 19 homolog 6-like isoform X3 [Magnolia sinica]|uniref:protein DEHYDRATION-INDUCED 19 homolog 6-like isoform X3 n=1 Tax=Magnolia sinica TaxID=86752 RepID=UPI00265B3891|nr:protein DEHYDRATION-INDUCED 19 homolog 6-like isoform X3 [Magnolia sinica]
MRCEDIFHVIWKENRCEAYLHQRKCEASFYLHIRISSSTIKVCPVCAANLGKDMIGHFTVQHWHLLKRRRKSQRTGAAVVGKDLRELSSFLAVASTNGRGNVPDSAPDPLLSPFLYRLATPHATTVNQDASSGVNAMVDSLSSEVQREPTTPNGAREQQADEERNQRAVFVQHLLVSTIF